MSGLTTGIDDLLSTSMTGDVYKATASLENGAIDGASVKFSGDRGDDSLFTNKNELGKDDFLQLLVKQMQYQDPLEPMDNTEFVAQLAQFSALEGNTNIEKAINNLDDSFQSSLDAQTYSAQSQSNAAAVSLIGKDVRLKQDSIHYTAVGGNDVPIRVHVGNNDSAKVQIKDSDGNVIRTLEASGKDAENSVTAYWDGMKDDGTHATSGEYEISIVGSDADPSLYAFVQDVVEGVRFAKDGPLVKIGGQEMSIGQIMDVSIGEPDTGFGGLSSSSAIELLGKDVRYRQDSISFSGLTQNQANALEPLPDIELNIAMNGRSNAEVTLVNASGETVAVLNATAGADGVGVVHWNGMSDSGEPAKAGVYSVKIAGQNSDPSLYSFAEGTVNGVSNIGRGTEIRVGGNPVSLSSIIDISDNT